jgi:5'-nucleotidase
MRILLTNDDGIEAPGLDVLEKIATDLTDDVWVVAPETDNSGASHSLTLAEPLRMRDLGKRHYAIKGTPTDCVIMGVRFLLHEKPPDLVMSGVNRGQNLADDITYSGTVAGAIQGCLLGIPSMAMSLVTGPAEADQGTGEPLWETPMHYGADLVQRLMREGWPEGVVLNVNFPNCTPESIKGICATVQGQRDPDIFRIIDRLDARGRAYYWIGVERRRAKPPEGTDLWAVRCKQISVTPLCLDNTDQATRENLSRVLDDRKPGARVSQRARKATEPGRAVHSHRE